MILENWGYFVGECIGIENKQFKAKKIVLNLFPIEFS